MLGGGILQSRQRGAGAVPPPEAHVVIGYGLPHLVVHHHYCVIVAVESEQSFNDIFMQPLGPHHLQDPKYHHKIESHLKIVVEDAHTFSVAVGGSYGISGSIDTMVDPSVAAHGQLTGGKSVGHCFLQSEVLYACDRIEI